MKNTYLVVFFSILCLLAFAGASRADIGLKGIGGELGIVSPSGAADTTFGLGVVGDLGTLDMLLENLRLEGAAEYWRDSWGTGYYEWSWNSLSIAALAKYDFPLNTSITPFVGGGLGLTFSRWSSDWKGEAATWWGNTPGVSTSSTDMDLSLQTVAGINMPIGSNMKLVLQGKYNIGGNDAVWLTAGLLMQLH